MPTSATGRRRWLLSWLATGAGVGAAHSAAGLPRRRTEIKMRPELSIDPRPFFCGEALPVRLKLVNDDGAAAAPDVGNGAPLHYELFAAPTSGSAAPLLQLTRRAAYDRQHAGDPHPPPDSEPQEVAPGAAIEQVDDLCALAGGFIAPGRYAVIAVWGSGPASRRSQPVGVQIDALAARQLRAVFSPYEDGFSVLSHHGRVLAERNTVGFPITEGVFHRSPLALPEGVLPALALSVDLAPRLKRNVSAWIDRGRLVSPALPAGSAVDLAGAALLHPGFQLANQHTVFVMLGTAGDGTAAQCVEIRGGAARALGAAVKISDRRVLHPAVCNPPDDEHTLVLVWAETAGETTRIVSRRFGTDGGARGAARSLTERRLSLLGLAVDAVVLNGPGWVHALWGPVSTAADATHPHVEYTMTALTGEPASRQHNVPVPQDVVVTEWAVGGGLEEKPVVAVATQSGYILYADAARFDGWPTLATRQIGAHALQVVKATKFRYWAALWLDPASGLRYKADPKFL